MIAFTIAIGVVTILLYLMYSVVFKSAAKEEMSTKENGKVNNNGIDKQKVKEKEKKQNVKVSAVSKDSVFKHKWLASTLKAHSDRVTGIDFSPNGKYLLSTGNGKVT